MSLAPTLGGSIASSVPVTTANANDYLLIDVTAAVGEWLNGSLANDGLALVANSGLPKRLVLFPCGINENATGSPFIAYNTSTNGYCDV